MSVALLLAASALAFALPIGPAAAYGERPYEWNQVVNGANLVVFDQQSVAQSFTPTETYVLLNVSLRVQNQGGITDGMNVSVRADAGGAPSASYLAAADIVSDGTVRLVSVPFPSHPVLAAGARYWIVASKGLASGEGYRWFHANADVYAEGWAATKAPTGVWTNRTTDMWFLTYGREEEANLTAGLSASPSVVQEKDPVTLTLYGNNTGTLPARRAWLNVTLPAGLTYVSDTAAAMGSTTPFPSYTFSNVANGDGTGHSFRLTARVDIGVAPGAVLTATARLEYVGGTWAPRPPSSSSASVTAGIVSKSLYLVPANRLAAAAPTGTTPTVLTIVRNTAVDFDLAPALARPFRVLQADAVLWVDAEKGNVQTLNWELALYDFDGVTLVPIESAVVRGVTDAAVSYQSFPFSMGAGDATIPAGHFLRFHAHLLGNSTDNARVATNATGAPSRLEFATTTFVRIDALQLRDGAGVPAAWSPRDPLVIRANVSDPFGAPEISAARVLLRDPGNGIVANGTGMSLLAADAGSPPLWKLFEFRYGPPLANGTYRAEVTAVEGNGVVDVAAGTALVRAPRLTLEKVATATRVASGDRFAYHLWFNNTGTGAARVWINDTLPAGLTLLGSSDAAAMTGTYNWTWASVAPGPHRLDLDVRVDPGVTSPFLENVATLAYADEKGHAWPPAIAEVDVAVNGPYLTVTLSASRADVHANESVDLTVGLVNSGADAQTVWVNDTLPAGLSYVSDTAASRNGTVSFAGRLVLFQFPPMPAGASWSFDLTVRVASGLPSGSSLPDAVTVDYTNLNGVRMPARNATYSLTLRAPAIAVAVLAFVPSTATPGDIVPATLDLWNFGNEPAAEVAAHVTLAPHLAVADASTPWSPEPGGARLDAGTAGIGASHEFLNLTVDASASDGEALGVGGTLDYADEAGNPMPPARIAPDSVLVAAPSILLAVTPADATVEAGMRLNYTVDVSNEGSGPARDLWVNATLPPELTYEGDTADGTRSVVGASLAWHWSDLPVGPRSFTVTLLARPEVSDGSAADVAFALAYADGNGNPRAGTNESAHVAFRASSITLGLTADAEVVSPGSLVTYSVHVRNNGSAPAAFVRVSDAIDPHLTVVSWDADAPATGTTSLNWTFTAMEPGQEEVITLVVRVAESGGPELLSNAVEATFTNGGGTVIGYVRTPPVTIRVLLPGPPVALYAGLAVLVGAAVAGGVVLRRRRRGNEIEEVFLVYRDGVLLHHLSRSLTGTSDEDVLSGMLTAVQEFVRDAFKYGADRRVRELDFGDYHIVFERGANVYLAVVTSGAGEDPKLRKKLRQVIAGIEIEHGDLLNAWNGVLDEVLPLRDDVSRLIRKGSRGGHAHPTPPTGSRPGPGRAKPKG